MAVNYGRLWRAKWPEKDGKVGEATLMYDKGGINYFNYKEEPRGYWLGFVEKEVKDTGSAIVETYSPFDVNSFKIFLASTTRFSFNKAQDMAKTLEANKLKIGELYTGGQFEELREFLTGPCGIIK